MNIANCSVSPHSQRADLLRIEYQFSEVPNQTFLSYLKRENIGDTPSSAIHYAFFQTAPKCARCGKGFESNCSLSEEEASQLKRLSRLQAALKKSKKEEAQFFLARHIQMSFLIG